ncbi:TPA: hypothetical protein KRE09_002251 [Clostridioides difficile]|uniref:hypothetical protein n=1 Tax=Clostridioides difficile TaxID=1496 RepID=UPI0005B4D6AF|nr:hypothetical protein [Clostridioides difficile]AUO78291.1 hypothetical protein LIBA6276_00073 [Clostridioides phage LIBA6276]EGT4117194.1 hypothetical protein [Clostridioides difficile]EGT5086704.1 hypothetical protein [Clostridioides difficile]EIS9354910.1 hypothetical protein [Clostridioides difficile]MBN6005996.1 hypothetical protein [Clostridioides difficile]
MEFSEQIIKILDNLSDKFGMTIDWSNKNVIPYLQTLTTKYINYEVDISIFWIIICVIGIIVGALLIYIDWKDDEDDIPVYATIGLLIIIFSAVFIIIQSIDIITAKTFPEKIILNYLLEIKKYI